MQAPPLSYGVSAVFSPTLAVASPGTVKCRSSPAFRQPHAPHTLAGFHRSSSSLTTDRTPCASCCHHCRLCSHWRPLGFCSSRGFRFSVLVVAIGKTKMNSSCQKKGSSEQDLESRGEVDGVGDKVEVRKGEKLCHAQEGGPAQTPSALPLPIPHHRDWPDLGHILLLHQ